MDLILTYLIERGGVFGLLFAISLAWIMFREKQLFGKPISNKDGSSNKDFKENVDKILYIVEDIKSRHEESSQNILEISPIVRQIYDLEKAEAASVEKISVQLSGVDSKLSDSIKKTQDLWDWHSVKDPEGVPIWYVRRSLEESINKLELSVDSLKEGITKSDKSLRDDLEERLQESNDKRILELKKMLKTYNTTVTDLILALEKMKVLFKEKKRGKHV